MRPFAASRHLPTGLLVVGALLLPGSPARAQSGAGETVQRVERGLVDVAGKLKLLADYVDRDDDSQLLIAQRRFSEAETQFLLDNWEACSVMLGEVVDLAPYRNDPTYPRALFYLAESLYQQHNFREARRYFRDAIRVMSPGVQYQDAIERLIALAVRSGDNDGIDEYYATAVRANSIRPGVRYAYAKWTSRRVDLPLADRLKRADADFAQIQPNDAPYLQALYFRGALAVAEGRLEDAAARFNEILAQPAPADASSPAARVRNLAHLAIARVLYEQGKNDEAVAQYNKIPQQSDEYIESRFEVASTFVKMGLYEQALNMAEILQILGRDGDVVPESVADARILQGNLQLKLARYEEANATFNDIVQSYGPVRDQIRASIERPDPVGYFDELLRRNDKGLDIEQLLPAPARPWAKTNRELEDAQVISTEIGQSKEWIADARRLVDRLVEKLASGRLDTFAQYQEGNGRAVQIGNTLVSFEDQLVAELERTLASAVSGEDATLLSRLSEERRDLAEAIESLPKNDEAIEERRGKINSRVFDWERLLKKEELKLTGMQAELRAMEYYLRTTRAARGTSDYDEDDMLNRVRQDLATVEQLESVRTALIRQIREQRMTADAQAAGGDLEEKLRQDYTALVAKTQPLVDRASSALSPADAGTLARIQKARVEVASLQTRLAEVRGRMRDRALARLDDMRKKVMQEQRTLEDQEKLVAEREDESRQLLGKIAYASFSRLARQFYDVVLKADVGLIDVAWSRKKEIADRISQTAEDKKTELEDLQEQFKDVLNDVD